MGHETTIIRVAHTASEVRSRALARIQERVARRMFPIVVISTDEETTGAGEMLDSVMAFLRPHYRYPVVMVIRPEPPQSLRPEGLDIAAFVPQSRTEALDPDKWIERVRTDALCLHGSCGLLVGLERLRELASDWAHTRLEPWGLHRLLELDHDQNMGHPFRHWDTENL